MAWLDVVEEYKGSLILQYRNKTKAKATIGTFVNCSICDGLPLSLQYVFDLETASGDQLEILGRIVGVNRDVKGLDLTHTFFNFTRYSGTPTSIGFQRYTTTQPDSPLFLRYRTDAIYTLTEFELKTLIKLKIVYNNSHETYYTIKTNLYKYFQGGIDVGPGSSVMTVEYTVNSIYRNSFLAAIFLKTVPCPMGVGITTTYV